MPVRYTDQYGKELKGGTTHITGGCCLFTVFFIFCGVIGMWVVVNALLGKLFA